MEAARRSLRLLKTRKMFLLMWTFFYTGLELTFFSGVYGPCVGFTEAMGKNAKVT